MIYCSRIMLSSAKKNLVLVFNATISNISAISWRRPILSKWYIVFLMNTIDILFASHVNNNQEILFWNKSENSLMIDCVSVALYQMRSMVFFWWNDRWLRRYQINGLVPAYEFILWFPQVKGSCFLVLDLQMQLNHFLFLLLLIIKIITAWNKLHTWFH